MRSFRWRPYTRDPPSCPPGSWPRLHWSLCLCCLAPHGRSWCRRVRRLSDRLQDRLIGLADRLALFDGVTRPRLMASAPVFTPGHHRGSTMISKNGLVRCTVGSRRAFLTGSSHSARSGCIAQTIKRIGGADHHHARAPGRAADPASGRARRPRIAPHMGGRPSDSQGRRGTASRRKSRYAVAKDANMSVRRYIVPAIFFTGAKKAMVAITAPTQPMIQQHHLHEAVREGDQRGKADDRRGR